MMSLPFHIEGLGFDSCRVRQTLRKLRLLLVIFVKCEMRYLNQT